MIAYVRGRPEGDGGATPLQPRRTGVGMSVRNAPPVPNRSTRAVRPHRPMRPTWLCRVCAAPWPCQPARLLLGLEYRGDRIGLAIYMAGMLFDATGDLLALNPNPGPQPADLFARFISWTR